MVTNYAPINGEMNAVEKYLNETDYTTIYVQDKRTDKQLESIVKLIKKHLKIMLKHKEQFEPTFSQSLTTMLENAELLPELEYSSWGLPRFKKLYTEECGLNNFPN